MKSIILAGLLLGAAHGAAQAGPYVNVEANSGSPEVTTPVLQLMSMSVTKALTGMYKAVLHCWLLMVATVMSNCLVRQVAAML